MLYVVHGTLHLLGHDDRTAADRAGTVHHEVRPTAAQFVELMPKLAFAMDEPAAGPGLFPQYLVSAMARGFVFWPVFSARILAKPMAALDW